MHHEESNMPENQSIETIIEQGTQIGMRTYYNHKVVFSIDWI